MECDVVAEQLGAWLDGELAPAEESQVKQHLDGCPGCRGRRDLLLATQAAVLTLPCESVSPAFEAGLQRRLERLAVRPAGRAPRSFVPALVLGLAAIVVVALVLPRLHDRRTQSIRPVAPSALIRVAWAPPDAWDCELGDASARCQIVRPCADPATCGRSVGRDWPALPLGPEATPSDARAR